MTTNQKKTTKKEALALVAKQDNQYAPIQFAYSEKDAMKLAQDFSRKYGFDIERGDVMIYNQNGALKPYVTAQGCSKIQLSQAINTDIKLMESSRQRPFFAMVQCTATRVNENNSVVESKEIGYCDSEEPGKSSKPFSQILAMAITRARNRAIKSLSQLTTTFEEFSETDEQTTDAKDLRAIIDVPLDEIDFQNPDEEGPQ